ncbi:hypothetical protein CCMA1212_008746 [Trichoderma ghanense]|uniref:RBR-type E3 ubiquitin transferase n=1 Tax=Trichoderma ghanense TaxID=65468 RepID=A0ABY2GU27_9HYPO
MFRSIRRKTQAAFSRRKTNKSITSTVTQVTAPADVDWPFRDDYTHPPSTTHSAATNTVTPGAASEQPTSVGTRRQSSFEGNDDRSAGEESSLDVSYLEEPLPGEQVDAAEGEGAEEELREDLYTTKYVPFVETSAMRNNMFVHAATSHYGMVNPAIMGGFGDDDESIWLVDDEETEEGPAGRREREEDESEEEERKVDEEEEPDVALPPASQPPTVPSVSEAASMAGPQTGFRYRINYALFDDDEFAASQGEDTTPTSVSVGRASSPRPRSSGTDSLGHLSIDNESRHPNGGRDEAGVSNGSSTPATSNPYVDLLEQQDSAMTVAYQRRLDLSGRRGDDEADDFSFGQRYQKDPGTSAVLVTHQRVPADHAAGDQDCSICADTKESILFPRFSPTAFCEHPPTACLECLERSIRSDLNSKIWTDIRCPECRGLLDYTDIQRYADEETFKRYETLALRAAMAEAENFFWCTSGCGSGQIHETGHELPIVICLHCSHRSCFHHNVAWHQGLTCDEYDQLLADPDNFRSRLEIDNDAWAASQQAQLNADRAMAQGLLEEERRAAVMRQRREREERERTRKAIELARQIAARRKIEEEMSRITVGRTTKPCPGCGWAIEKNDGCSHMTCVKCKHQFCYECGADHRQILENDNTAHLETCRFHPNQLEESGAEEMEDTYDDDEEEDEDEERDFSDEYDEFGLHGDFPDEEDEEEGEQDEGEDDDENEVGDDYDGYVDYGDEEDEYYSYWIGSDEAARIHESISSS